MAGISEEHGVRRVRARRDADRNQVSTRVLQEVVHDTGTNNLDRARKVAVKEDCGLIPRTDLVELLERDEESEGERRVLFRSENELSVFRKWGHTKARASAFVETTSDTAEHRLPQSTHPNVQTPAC